MHINAFHCWVELARRISSNSYLLFSLTSAAHGKYLCFQKICANLRAHTYVYASKHKYAQHSALKNTILHCIGIYCVWQKYEYANNSIWLNANCYKIKENCNFLHKLSNNIDLLYIFDWRNKRNLHKLVVGVVILSLLPQICITSE